MAAADAGKENNPWASPEEMEMLAGRRRFCRYPGEAEPSNRAATPPE